MKIHQRLGLFLGTQRASPLWFDSAILNRRNWDLNGLDADDRARLWHDTCLRAGADDLKAAKQWQVLPAWNCVRLCLLHFDLSELPLSFRRQGSRRMSLPIQPLLVAAVRAPSRWRLLRIAARLLSHEQGRLDDLLRICVSEVGDDQSALLCIFGLFCRSGHEAEVTGYAGASSSTVSSAAAAALATAARASEDKGALTQLDKLLANVPAVDDAALRQPLDETEVGTAYLLADETVSVRLTTLIALLESPDAKLRERARLAIEARGPSCADDLFAALPRLPVASKASVIAILAEFRYLRLADFLGDEFSADVMNVTDTAMRALASFRTDRGLRTLLNVAMEGRHRGGALAAVASYGQEGLDAILDAFRKHPSFRRSGARPLAFFLKERALPALFEAFDDPLRVVRDGAEQGLALLGTPAVPELLRRLRDPTLPVDIHVRAIRLLTLTQTTEATLTLLEIAEKERGAEQLAAIEALGSYPNGPSMAVLKAASNSADRRIRVAGQRAWKAMQSTMVRPSPVTQPASELQAPSPVPGRQSQQSDAGAEELHPIDRWIQSTVALHDPSWRLGPVPAADQEIGSEVHFSVTAPQCVTPKQTFILDVWAHAERQSSALKQAAQLEPIHLRHVVRTVGPAFIDKGVRLAVELSIPEFSHADENSLSWAGAPGNCNFAVTVPDGIASGAYVGIVSIRLGSIRVTRVSFLLAVGDRSATTVADVTGFDTRALRWFASYASEDRKSVLARIQGMQKVLPELDVFVDVMSLRSGQNWRKRIDGEIAARDGLYLFWSPAAMHSTYVDHEWRTAFRLKGIDGIDPVPLASPSVAPPPAELRDLHFHEWTLAFEN